MISSVIKRLFLRQRSLPPDLMAGQFAVAAVTALSTLLYYGHFTTSDAFEVSIVRLQIAVVSMSVLHRSIICILAFDRYDPAAWIRCISLSALDIYVAVIIGFALGLLWLNLVMFIMGL